MADYKLLDGGGVLHQPSGMIVPRDPGNRHWVAYQDWLAAGNTPDAADPSPSVKRVEALGRLSAIDLKSVRAIREFIAGLPNAPQILLNHEAEAQAARRDLS